MGRPQSTGAILIPEEWRPFPGIEEFYEISNMGRCRSANTRHGSRKAGHIIAPELRESGYVRYNLRPSPHKSIHRFAHIAVAKAFHGNPPSPRHKVAHADGVRSNNCWLNLSWKTQKDNLADRYLHGTDLNGESNPAAKLTRSMVVLARAAYSHGVPRTIICDAIGISKSQFLRIVKHQSWSYDRPLR